MKLFPVTVKRTTAQASGDGDIVWAETLHATDKPKDTVAFPDTAHASDRFGTHTLGPGDTLHATDARASSMPSGQMTSADTVNVTDREIDNLTVFEVLHGTDRFGTDTLKHADTLRATDKLGTDTVTHSDTAKLKPDKLSLVRITNANVGRSGSPDADVAGDAWIDKANTGTNHGNEDLSVNGEVLNTEKRGLLEFDFTKFGNLTRLAGGTHRFVFRASHSAAVGSNDLRVRLTTQASRPFTESTVTWTGEPAEGANLKSVAVAVTAGAAADYTITISDAEMANFLGNWVYVRMLSEATLPATVFTVVSRDNATAANRPRWSFDLERV